MCDFHSIVVRADGAEAHVFGNSHSTAVEKAGWMENEPHKRKRFVEVEWNGVGEYPGADKITRLDDYQSLTAKQRTTIDRRYKALAKVMAGDLSRLATDFSKPVFRDVWLAALRGKVDESVHGLASLFCEQREEDAARITDALFAAKDNPKLPLVWNRFAVWMLTDKKRGVLKYAKPKGKEAIIGVAALHSRTINGDKVLEKEWAAAWAVARDAAWAVAGAVARDAAGAVARDAAWDAAGAVMSAKFIELLEDAAQ